MCIAHNYLDKYNNIYIIIYHNTDAIILFSMNEIIVNLWMYVLNNILDQDTKENGITPVVYLLTNY